MEGKSRDQKEPRRLMVCVVRRGIKASRKESQDDGLRDGWQMGGNDREGRGEMEDGLRDLWGRREKRRGGDANCSPEANFLLGSALLGPAGGRLGGLLVLPAKAELLIGGWCGGRQSGVRHTTRDSCLEMRRHGRDDATQVYMPWRDKIRKKRIIPLRAPRYHGVVLHT